MNNNEMTRRIIELQGEMIDLKRFYLAFRISQCEECKKNTKVHNWESPIIFVAINSQGLCEQHKKEIDEFNRKHASD